MTSTVRIVSGSYRKAPINNQVFTLVKGYQLGAKGGFVTVKNEGQFPGRSDELRIQVDNQQQLEFIDRKSTRLNSSHTDISLMRSSA